jgi:two-component system KDP operon response regulator KdpE
MLKGKVLIVDDDRDIRLGFHVHLQKRGFETVFAEDAITAASVARKEKPDAILLDLGLPAGDGFVVLERLKRMVDVACIPIIVVTARPERENKQRALAAGAVEFLQKPIDNDDLFAAIENAMSRGMRAECAPLVKPGRGE